MSKKDVKNYYDYQDKKRNIKYHVKQAFNKSLSMFKYHNLPDTMPQKFLELFLQRNGYVGIIKENDNLYCLNGGLGGTPDMYNEPTTFIVSNPYLKLNKEYIINQDCVIIDNDMLRNGMTETFNKYATFLTENEISMMIASINTRINSILSAGDSNTIASAKEFINQIEAGKLAVIADNAFLESLKVHNFTQSKNADILETLIKMQEYLKSALFNAMGLQANTNLKKERLITSEVDMLNYGIYPTVDNMLECRRIGVQKVNDMFGTSIEVEFNSSWDYRYLNGQSIHNVNDEVKINETMGETTEEKPKEESTKKYDEAEGTSTDKDTDDNEDTTVDETVTDKKDTE